MSGYHNNSDELESLHQPKLLLLLSPMVVFTDIKFGYNLNLPWIRSNFEIMGKGYTIYTIKNGVWYIMILMSMTYNVVVRSFIIALPNLNCVECSTSRSFYFNTISSQFINKKKKKHDIITNIPLFTTFVVPR